MGRVHTELKSALYRLAMLVVLIITSYLLAGEFLQAESARQPVIVESIEGGTSLPPYEINFDSSGNGRFMTHQELVLWARNHNLLLVPDAPHRNLQDGLARVIPASGLRFSLSVPASGRSYLYLDLVAYRPQSSHQLSKVYFLDVIANGRLMGRIYQGGGRFLESPQILVVDREHAPEGILHLELRPSPGDAFIAIWDAFVSKHAELNPAAN